MRLIIFILYAASTPIVCDVIRLNTDIEKYEMTCGIFILAYILSITSGIIYFLEQAAGRR